MAQISVVVNGRSYAVTCDDGQEEHVLRLTAEIDRRVAELVSANGQVGQERLLLLVSLLLADELSEKPAERGDGAAGEEAVPSASSAAPGDTLGEELHTLAQRIETMAHRLRPATPDAVAGALRE
jgi:cell division protein ZapA